MRRDGDALTAGALKRNTLDADQYAIGSVYFDRQKKGQLIVSVTVGAMVLHFPFDAKTRE